MTARAIAMRGGEGRNRMNEFFSMIHRVKMVAYNLELLSRKSIYYYY
jgi:hypothetical protein